MMSDAVKLSTVERLIANRRPFPRAIREQFERDSRERHERRLVAVIWPSIIVYNVLLGVDYFPGAGRLARFGCHSLRHRHAARRRRCPVSSPPAVAHLTRDARRARAVGNEPAGPVHLLRDDEPVC